MVCHCYRFCGNHKNTPHKRGHPLRQRFKHFAMPSPTQATRPVSETAPHPASIRNQLLLVFAICFISINLRSALISVGPVVESIRHSLNLSGTQVGLLLTLPILCFGAFAPFAPKLLRFRSAEQLVTLAMALLSLGIILRSLFGTVGLFAGTFISGAAISVVMVLLPSLIKKNFPAQAGAMMGLYSTALCLGATVAAALTVPLESIPGSDWRWALVFWDLPLFVAIALWLPYSKAGQANPAAASAKLPRLRSSALAWQVSLFMGIQSAIAYCVFGWLPVILVDRGLTPLAAGFMLSICMGVQLITSLAAPIMASRAKDQRSTIALMIALSVTGLMTTIYAPLQSMWLWSTILGLGLGGVFSMALALLVLRSPTPQVAAALSGMSQGVGYTVAATGPVIVGMLHEYTGNWDAVAVFYLLLACGSLTFGMGAGRNLHITPAPAS